MATFNDYISFLEQQHNTTSFNSTLKSALSSANTLEDRAKSANTKLKKYPNFDEKIASDINLICQSKDEVETIIVGANDVLSALDIHINTIEPKFQELYTIIKERSFSKVQVQQEHLEMADKMSNRHGSTFSASKANRLGIEIDELIETIQDDLKERDKRLKELGDSRKLQILIASGVVLIILFILFWVKSTNSGPVPTKKINGSDQGNISTQKSNKPIAIPTNKTISPSTNNNSSDSKNSTQPPKEQIQQYKWVTCTDCKGQGQVQSNESCSNCSGDGLATCSKCNGSTKYSCTSCNGEKKFICRSCDGKKQIVCNYCDGTKSVDCSKCIVKGILTCGQCGGDGTYYGVCSFCNGKGTKPCTICNQTGNRPCNPCNQTGYEPCSSCNQTGYKPCSSCNQTGYKPCSSCSQTGNVKCRSCNGIGQVSEKVNCSKCEGRRQIQVKI